MTMELFKTNIGSTIWKMNHKDSDMDIGIVYLMDSRDFLLGKKFKGKQVQNKDENTDLTYYELGAVIEQLMKGNVNYLWLVMSPIIISQYGSALDELRRIVSKNYSKNTYHSVNGLAKNNICDLFLNNDPESLKYKKKLGITGRALNFGTNLLMWHDAIFEPITVKNVKEIEYLMNKLDEVLEYSSLPERTNPEPFQEYLIKYRLLKLKLDGFVEKIKYV